MGQVSGAGSAEAAEPPAATRWQPAPRDAAAAGQKEASPRPGAEGARVQWGSPGSEDPRGFQGLLSSNTLQDPGVAVGAPGLGFSSQIQVTEASIASSKVNENAAFGGPAEHIGISFENSQALFTGVHPLPPCHPGAPWRVWKHLGLLLVRAVCAGIFIGSL